MPFNEKNVILKVVVIDVWKELLADSIDVVKGDKGSSFSVVSLPDHNALLEAQDAYNSADIATNQSRTETAMNPEIKKANDRDEKICTRRERRKLHRFRIVFLRKYITKPSRQHRRL